MTDEPWRWAVQVVREDRTPVGQVPVELDWEPAREWLRFDALRQGVPPARALTLDCEVEPIWHDRLGEPHVEGVQLRAGKENGLSLQRNVGASFFAAPARAAIDEMVKAGTLAEGAEVRCLPLAFARDAAASPERSRLTLRPAAPELAIPARSMPELLNGSSGPIGEVHEEDIAVFLPRSVTDDAVALTQSADGPVETGGVLIGHVCRDSHEGDLFVEVTALLPARHVEATSTKLSFTSETWTAFRSAIALRGRAEIMVGWFHSHPVREWCSKCPEESQRTCALRDGFLSEDDRLLHRTLFPRAYSIALVASDVAWGDTTLALFGWRRGQIERRAYHRIEDRTEGRNRNA